MSENDIEKQIRYLALMRIFEQHITNFCSVYSDSLAEAQDLMQEFYANMWEKIDQLRPESTLAQQNRWIHRVLVTTLVRHLRHNPFHRRVPLAAAARMPAADDHTAELLDDILSVLPPADRRLIDARLQGYSFAEIAENLHSTPEAVKQRVYRIMKTLKKYKP